MTKTRVVYSHSSLTSSDILKSYHRNRSLRADKRDRGDKRYRGKNYNDLDDPEASREEVQGPRRALINYDDI